MSTHSEAMQLFADIASEEAHNRQQFVTAMRFYNGEQWPEGLRRSRETDPYGARPCLTVNVLPHHVKQVTNEMRQNRPSIRVLPVDDGADIKTAKALQGLIRHIENRSDADVVYTTAGRSAVIGGVGYWRILSDYVDQTYNYQELRLSRIVNAMTVYMSRSDCPAGSDADDVFITEMVHKDRFKAMFGKAPPSSITNAGTGDDSWLMDDYVQIAEWFHVDLKSHKAVVMPDGSREKQADVEAYQRDTGMRVEYNAEGAPIVERRVRWVKMSGAEVLEERDIEGRYIPVVRVVGQEVDIEGRRYYYGMVRDAIDPCRMRNYWRSCETEMIALAPKAPFLLASGQVDGYEDRWRLANTANLPYLEYNQVDVDGEKAPMPQRQPAASLPSAIVQAAANADWDIKAATGIFGAALGEPSNEKSGKAIIERKSESDVSTYDYIDNLSIAIRHTGRILVNRIPFTYDTARIQRVLGEGNEPTMMKLDPNSPSAYQDVKTDEYQGVFNPNVGRYDVEIQVGPSFATKREEAAQSMATILQGNPALWQAAGDLFAKNLDWPGADALAERLKRMVPKELLGDEENEAGEAPQGDPADKQMIAQLDQTIQAMSAELEQAQAGEAEKVAKANADKAKTDLEMKRIAIEAYKAETERMKFIAEHPQSLPLLKAIGMMEDLIEEPDGDTSDDEPPLPGFVPGPAPDMMQ